MGEHLREAGIDVSMGVKGALDNAIVESFFATLKRELVNRYLWPTKADARAEIFEWIEVSTTAPDSTRRSAITRRRRSR